MSKYDPLTVHLRGSGQASVSMTFAAIERIVGAKLPPSAYKYRAWWSNNPTNSVITHAWLDAGYKTANVDMAGSQTGLPKIPSGRAIDCNRRWGTRSRWCLRSGRSRFFLTRFWRVQGHGHDRTGYGSDRTGR